MVQKFNKNSACRRALKTWVSIHNTLDITCPAERTKRRVSPTYGISILSMYASQPNHTATHPPSFGPRSDVRTRPLPVVTHEVDTVRCRPPSPFFLDRSLSPSSRHEGCAENQPPVPRAVPLPHHLEPCPPTSLGHNKLQHQTSAYERRYSTERSSRSGWRSAVVPPYQLRRCQATPLHPCAPVDDSRRQHQRARAVPKEHPLSGWD